jgi:cation diffusion facilitator CzcD-associated flavoprotein CzcO
VTDGNGSAPEHFRVLIIGSGFSGLGMAIRLKERGLTHFAVLERLDGLGGTWRANHYPGLCCDVPSHLYSYSFELNRHWTRGFASGPEIREYLDNTAEKYGVLPFIRFGHEVQQAAWNDDAQRWDVETNRGRMTAEVLVSAAGALSEPSVPDIPGLDSFEGHAFHSADWDHEHDLAGKRVAVVGTGASAIQFVPQIQPLVSKLYVFQRTPPWIIPRLDHEITKPEHFLLRWIPFAEAFVRLAIYVMLEVRVLGFRRPAIMRLFANVAKWHLKRQVPDPQLREKLTPDYVIGCKRILIADDYYPALSQPNVEVITSGVQEIRPRAVVGDDGTEHEVDTIIWGTGFRVTDPPIAHRVRGRAGLTLMEHFKRDGFKALYGISVPGFPNLFYMLGPNTGLGHTSMVYMIESQIRYILDALRKMERSAARTVDVRPEVVDEFDQRVQRLMEGTVWTAGHCHSWYLDDTGRNTTLWPTWTISYRNKTRSFDPGKYVATNGVQTPTAVTTGPSPAPPPAR